MIGKVLHTGLNNSEIGYKKFMYFPDGGVCTLLTLYVYAAGCPYWTHHLYWQIAEFSGFELL